MAMPHHFQLGLLPERKMDWRTLATSYGLELLLILFLVNIGLILPEKLNLSHQYHITELIPMPSLRPEPYRPKPLPLHTKLLPPAPLPVTTPKLVVPHERRR